MANSTEDSAQFALRFSWLRTFDHPVYVRVHREPRGYKLIVKEMSGAGGYEPGEIRRSKERFLTIGEVAQLRELLVDEGLFEEPAADCDIGFDGSEWLFELVDKEGYHLVKRWSPDEGAAHHLGVHMLKLAGWDFGDDY